MDLLSLNQHPWDWLSHAGIALIFWLGSVLIGYGLRWIMHTSWSIMLFSTMGAGFSMGIMYGREQSQHWKKTGDDVGSWHFWNWSMDANLDFWIPVLVISSAYLLHLWWMIKSRSET
jgi:hypothetical protein